MEYSWKWPPPQKCKQKKTKKEQEAVNGMKNHAVPTKVKYGILYTLKLRRL